MRTFHFVVVQLITVILGYLWTSNHPGIRARIELLMKQQKLTKKDVNNVLKDFTCVPHVFDLACMRDAMKNLGVDSKKNQSFGTHDYMYFIKQRDQRNTYGAVRTESDTSIGEDIEEMSSRNDYET
nr:beta-catenin-like protein 1 [Tanacetum cinerariifolium]